MSTPPTQTEPGDAGLLASLLAAALAGLACFKMLALYDPFPGWATDPTVSDVALGVSITPTAQLTINACIIVLSALGLLAAQRHHPRSATPGRWLQASLLLIGLCGIAWHTAANPDATVEDWLSGSDWAAAICAGAGMHALARLRKAGPIAAGILLGVIVLLAGKGAIQFFIEHDETVRTYKATREQILASNGWEPGSPTALAYERRLMQREATGWFGLSNVYGSIAGCCAVAITGLGLAAPRGRWRSIMWIVAPFAWGALLMSESKGAIIGAGLGAGTLLAAWLAHRRWLASNSSADSNHPRWWQRPVLLGAAAIAMIIAVHLGVMLRGLLADHLGELSLRFRWFYAQGAARIFRDHWGMGVGPAGFKDAYMLAKPPISPEDVASPHSIPWDLLAGLGIPGVALLTLWLTWIRDLGRSLATWMQSRLPTLPATPDRISLRVVIGTIAAIVLTSVWLEQLATTPETAIMKILALAGWGIAAIAIMALLASRPQGALALCAAGIGLAMHAQIEMTFIWAGSGTWFMAILGLAAGWSCEPATETTPSRLPATAWLPPLISLAGLFVVTVGISCRIPSTHRWESALIDAALEPLRMTRLHDQLVRIDGARTSTTEKQQLLTAAITDAGLTVPAGADLEAFINQSTIAAWLTAIPQLQAAVAAIPSHAPTHRALSQMAIKLAESLPQGSQRDSLIKLALAEADVAATLPRQRSQSLAWSATMRSQLARTGVIDRNDGLLAARSALQQASTIDPYNFQHHAQLALIAADLGDPIQARTHASEALALERAASLDPLRRMSDKMHQDMQRLESNNAPK